MKKELSFINTCIVLLVYIFPIGAQSVPITGIYNTGVDDSGVALPFGAVDTHYSASGLASDAFVISPHPAWVSAPVGSNWIGPSNGNTTDAVGDFIYTLTFNLSSFDVTTASISGEWAYDNLGILSLNGIATAFSNPTQFFSLSSFTLNSGFLAGLNTLEFIITNNPGVGINPSGLLVTNLSGDASLSATVPEPSTVLLLALGIVGVGLARKKTSV